MLAAKESGQKVKEIINELKKTGLWKHQVPAWVTDFEEKMINNENDFSEWLQFIYLPNCMGLSVMENKKHIVPQAIRFLERDVQKGKLLQLLIELDGLT